jgi:hypothetical protein
VLDGLDLPLPFPDGGAAIGADHVVERGVDLGGAGKIGAAEDEPGVDVAGEDAHRDGRARVQPGSRDLSRTLDRLLSRCRHRLWS